LTGTRLLRVCGDDGNALGKNINFIKKTQASRAVGLEVKTEYRKYMVMSSHQNSGLNHIY